MTAPISWTDEAFDVHDRALSVLRLDADDVDADRVGQLVEVAVQLVAQHLGQAAPWTPGNVPAPVLEAATTVTIELYRRKDAPFGVLNAWGADGSSVRVARDPLAGVTHLLDPYRERWGIA